MNELTIQALTEALHDHRESDLAAVRFATRYVPGAGAGAKVCPPTFPLDGRESPYVMETRYDEAGEPIETVLLDSVAAEANLVEQALLDAVDDSRIELPLLVLRASVNGRQVRLTSLDMPHRCSDAYLRDAQTDDGVPFDKTAVGKALRTASLRDATAVYRSCPTALLLGTWDSHRGRPELALKVPRAYTSELFGEVPQQGKRVGSRLDPLGMLGDKVKRGSAPDDWALIEIEGEQTHEQVEGTPKAKGGQIDKLSNVGHGNVAPSVMVGGCAVKAAHRAAVLSLGGLRRLRFPVHGQRSPDRDAAGRAVIAALGVLGDRLAFGDPDLSLRSGCDLVVTDDRVELVQRGGAAHPVTVARTSAIALFEEAVAKAADLGLTWDTTPMVVAPRAHLQRALESNLIGV